MEISALKEGGGANTINFFWNTSLRLQACLEVTRMPLRPIMDAVMPVVGQNCPVRIDLPAERSPQCLFMYLHQRGTSQQV